MENHDSHDNERSLVTAEDIAEIEYAKPQVLFRVLAEVIKRLPGDGKEEILNILQEALDGTDEAQTGLLPEEEPGFERMMYAQHLVVRDLKLMVESPTHWFTKAFTKKYAHGKSAFSKDGKRRFPTGRV